MPTQKFYLHIPESVAEFETDDAKILEMKELLMSKGIRTRIRMRTPNAKC